MNNGGRKGGKRLRKSLVVFFVLLFAVSLVAQQRTGNIFGKVSDPEGNPLPGVTVTLINPFGAPMTSVTSAEGVFRFLSLPPSRAYGVKMELTGFKTRIEENIVVAVANNTNLNLTMEMGVLEEAVTVTAVSPMVDTKKTAVGTNVTQEALQSLPTARDPWVILQMAPSVIVDRENVGGAESGQQSNYVGRGAQNYNNNVWAMDGVVITDPAAIGASPSYYDFDAFEEMQIVVGGADVTVQTGGIALNMVTRRGGNRLSFAGRFYMIDSKFQAKNEEFVAEKKAEDPYFLGLNLINNNKDYGFSMGGPIIKDKAWLWGSYGVQDIKTTTVNATKDDTLLTNYAAKLNIQIIPENRFEAFIHVGGKEKWGRSTSTSNPEGLYQAGRWHFGSPVVKFQDEHMFGNDLYISLKYAYSNAGFNMTPMTDLDFNDVAIWDVAAQRYYGSQSSRYWVDRPVKQYNFLGQYFNDSLFGVAHDVKIGFEYADRAAYTESVWTGNMMIRRNYNTNTWDWNGDGFPEPPPSAEYSKFKRFEYWRGYYSDMYTKALAGFFSDTITLGRFNLILGVRYDKQSPGLNPYKRFAVDDNASWNTVESGLKTKLDQILPGVDIAETKATYDNGVDGPRGGKSWFWNVWSPRLGLSWDVTGDGKTIAKLSVAQYGDFMGMVAGTWAPYGVGGWLDFWWHDTNTNNLVEASELYWHTIAAPSYQPYRVFNNDGSIALSDAQWADAYGNWWGGYDRLDPTAVSDPRTTYSEDSWGSSRTSEAMLTLERELFTDFAVTVNASYRKIDRFNWSNKFFVDANGNRYGFQTRDWYEIATHRVPAQIAVDPAKTKWDGNTGDAPNHDWYVMKKSFTEGGYTFDPSYTSSYSINTKRPDFYYDFYGVDLIITKRLSNKWMFDASVTLQNQKQHYGNGYWEPTNLWAVDDRNYAANIGGASGKINQYVFSRWLVKAGGLYQFPWDINASFTFLAREGWLIQETVGFVDYTLPNTRSRSFTSYIRPFGDDRLNTFYRFDFRLEKMFRLGDSGRIYVMADLFNVFDSLLENRRYQKTWGTYYYYGENDSRNYFNPTLNAYSLNELLNPRVLRLGVRFTF